MTYLLVTLSQSTFWKKGCSFSSYTPFVLPSLLEGFLDRILRMKSFAFGEICLGSIRTPLSIFSKNFCESLL